MSSTKKLGNGRRVLIVVLKSTEERLQTTCFRGCGVRKAGNFALWRSTGDLFNNTHVLRKFLRHVVEAFAAGLSQSRVTIKYHSDMGWSSTIPAPPYRPDSVEVFYPNRHSVAWRVKPSRTDITALPTDLITIAYEIRETLGRPTIFVHTIYPGRDVGALLGNVSARERVVFFDFDHPGDAI